LHSTKWSDGKEKKEWKPLTSKKNLICNSEGNEEKRYPVPDHNKTMIDDTKESSHAHKNTPKEEITETFMEKILDVVSQNVRNALKKFQDTKNKDYENTETNK
jgi:hypothetical protein